MQETNNVQLKRIKQKLHACQLVDIWRILNSKKQDFKFFSPVRGTYSRIDYILVEHRMIEWVKDSGVEISTLSDHSPVKVKMVVPGILRQSYAWRLNEDLIRDRTREKGIITIL